MNYQRYWISLGHLVRTLFSTMRSILSLMSILFTFSFTFAMLGHQLFGERFPDGRRSNFNTPWESFLTVAQVVFARFVFRACLRSFCFDC